MSVIAASAVEDVTLERMSGRDGASQPLYDGGTWDLKARVVREDNVVTTPGGTEVRTRYTLWFDESEPEFPLWEDRITLTSLGEERTVIVADRLEGRDLQGTLEFVRVRCREE